MSDKDVSASEIEDLLLPEDVPSDWSIRQIGDLKMMKNSRVKPEDMGEQNYVSLKHMGEGEPRIYEWESSEGVGSAKYKFQPGDIMFGKLRPYFRKVAMPKIDGICSTDINVIAATEEVDQKFLFYTLFRQDFIDISDKSSTGTRMPRADWSKLDKLNVALPPLEEQERIGEFLQAIDEKIEVNRAMAETLEDIAHAIYTSWFVDYEPYTEFKETELGDIPEDFKVGTLADVADITMGSSPKSEYYNEDGEGLPFFQGSKTFQHHFPDVDRWCTKEKKIAHSDDVLLSVRAPVGDVNQAREKCIVGRGVAALSMKGHSNEYLYTCLSVESKKWDMYKSGTTFNSVNSSNVREFPLAIPPAEKISEFNQIVEPAFKQIRANKQEIESLAELRDYLLPQLLSGEVRLGGDDA